MSENKKIVKNTIYLYIRAIISLVIGLYTSRVVIDVLGVDDYGVYGVAGGVVGMLAFLNASMSGATSRFIITSLGKDDESIQKKTFGNALTLHIWLAIVVVVFCESIGVWFLNYKLNIPEQSIYSANWVLQLSIITTAINITQVPYSALIMSHEKMSIYAYLELLNVTLKLLIVFMLLILPGNKLILYASLMTVASTIIALLYRFYCIRKFPESRTMPVYDKGIIKPMLSFSGWDLYGNSCVTFRNQGTTFILNIFFGVAINGASSIASVLNGTISGLSYNIIVAFRPQIIKSYAKESWSRFQELIGNGALYSSLLLSVMAIPLIFETQSIFQIWLGEVPPFVVDFSRITIVSAIIAQISSVITIGIHATGKIKLISFITGSIYLLSLPVIYFVLKAGLPPQSAFIIAIGFNILALIANIAILKLNNANFCVVAFVKNVVKLPLLILPACFVCCVIHFHVVPGIYKTLLVCGVSVCVTGAIVLKCVLTKEQRRDLIAKILKKHS